MKLHLFQFDTETAAQADAVVGAYWQPPYNDPAFGPSPGYWDQAYAFVNMTVAEAGIVQPGWWLIIAAANTNTSLAQHTNCRLAWDNENAVVLGGTLKGNDIAVLYASPVLAGAYNPWNGPAPQ